MKVLNLVQGSAEWHAHRAAHWNASDAPAMLGVSPYKSRGELLREWHSGVAREFSDYVQTHVVDPGHVFEANARAIAEKIIGDDLYPCTGVSDVPDCERFSASFDGLTLLGETAFEHKRLNEELRAIVSVTGKLDGDLLPEHYRVQMEHQIMVSGARRVLFMASEWGDDGKLIAEHHCWYRPDPVLRARIVAGWEQFERDLAAYTPEPAAAPAPIGRTPETLPALRVEAQGMVTYSNLAEFRSHAMSVLGGINRELATDEDFADAEQTVKWCKGVEDKLDAAKSAVLAQMQSVDDVCRTIDDIAAETRRVRLELDRLVKAEKDRRRDEIVTAGVDAVREHYRTINATLGEHALGMAAVLSADIGRSIKGLKTLASIRNAVDTAVANAKIAVSQRAERVRACIAVLTECGAGNESLFPDRVALCAEKAPDDLRNLVAARIAEHRAREAEKNATRAVDHEQPSPAAVGGLGDYTGELRAAGEPGRAVAKPPTSTARVKLGDINALIAPLRIDAEGLAQLGFESVGHDRSAKLYNTSDLPAMLRSMIDVLRTAGTESAARAA